MPHRLLDVGQVGRVAPHGRGGDDVVDVAPAAGHRLGHRGVEVGLVEPDDAESGLVAGVHEVEPEGVVDEDAGVLGVVDLGGQPLGGRPVGGVGVGGDGGAVAVVPAGYDVCRRGRDEQCRDRVPGAGDELPLVGAPPSAQHPVRDARGASGEDEREERQGLDDVHRGQVAGRAQGHQREDGDGERGSGQGPGGHRPAPGDQEEQRAREAAQRQHAVVVEPGLQDAVRAGALVEDESRTGPGQLVFEAVPQRDVSAAGEELALEEGEERVRHADQHAGRDGAGEGELAGVPVAVAPHGDHHRGQDEDHRLFGEDGRGGGDARPEVVPEVTARGGGEAERDQRPHHRDVVEEDLPLEDDRQR